MWVYTQWNACQLQRRTLLFTGKWMQLGIIILSELSQSQNDRYHVPSDMWFLDFI